MSSCCSQLKLFKCYICPKDVTSIFGSVMDGNIYRPRIKLEGKTPKAGIIKAIKYYINLNSETDNTYTLRIYPQSPNLAMSPNCLKRSLVYEIEGNVNGQQYLKLGDIPFISNEKCGAEFWIQITWKNKPLSFDGMGFIEIEGIEAEPLEKDCGCNGS